jgi:uncharacterized protein YjdB
MKKLYAAAIAALAMLVAACGDNGVRSPDFDAVLIDILVDGPSQRVVGTTAQFRALGHFTTPPSTQGAVATEDITVDSAWSVVVPVSSPGGTTPEEACRLSTTPSSAATVNNVGLVTANSPGTVYIKATFRDKAGCKPFAITPDEGTNCNVTPRPAGCPPITDLPSRIEVQPESQTTTPGGTTGDYRARAFFAGDSTPREITGVTVTWATGDPTVATLASPVPSTNGGCCMRARGTSTVNSTRTTTISATATFTSGSNTTTLSDTALVVVTPGVPRTVLRIVPETATIEVNSTQKFTACGTFEPAINDPEDDPTANPPVDSICDTPDRPDSEPVGHPISDDLLDWTSSDPDIATIGESTGIATGVAPGTVTITGALEENVGDPAGKRSDTATLTVLPEPLCKVPYLASPSATLQGHDATTTVERGDLCLNCTVDNPNFVIDAPPATTSQEQEAETFAEMNVGAALLDILLGEGFVSLLVEGDDTFSPLATVDPDVEGGRAGFIIRRPTADLLLAEVLAQTSIQTTLGGVAQETFTGTTCNVDVNPPDCTPGGSTSDTLAVEVLGGTVLPGGISPEETRVLIYTSHVNMPYDGIRLIFSGGVASVLPVMHIYNACAEVVLPPDVENPPEP